MKPQKRLDGTFVGKKITTEAQNIPVFILEEDETTIYDIPVFDISGYGYTDEEAKASLITVLNKFFRYTTNKKTYETELIKLGWKSKKNKKYVPPSRSKLVKERAYLTEIIDEHEFIKLSIEMPTA